jgi:enoyl-[acyl-carrier protein] reductase III
MKGGAFDFTGRRALVTGASRGIGAAIAGELAACGASVFVNYRQDREGAERVVRGIQDAGGTATPVQANMASTDDIRSLIRVAASGGLDILVHNAAIGSFKHAMDVRANQWDLTLGVNARALLTCAQEALPHMGAGGAIVAVSSLGSQRVVPAYGAIGVSKAALEALVRYLAVELVPRGIRVNAVSAGVVDTTALDHHPGRAELLEHAAAHAPAHRLGTPLDVARVVLFLCSPLAEWIVGQTVVADGGLSLEL